MTLKRQRMLFLALGLGMLTAGVLLAMHGMRDQLVFYRTPSELEGLPSTQRLRVGGMVEKGSLSQADNKIEFVLHDGTAGIKVRYTGLLPDLFREGQGVVAEGVLERKDLLAATRILAKHDENYMPPEVMERLKQSGRWRGKLDMP